MYCENCAERINTLCGCTAEVWNVQADGAYSKLPAIEGY